jgi:penicillin-binding protein 1A
VLRRRRPSPAPEKPARRIRKLRLLLVVVLIGLMASASFTFGLVTAIAGEIPELDPAYQKSVEVDGYIYANDGKTVLAVLRGSESRVLLKPAEIAPVMKRAIIAIEDRRFLEHRGVDVRAVARAAWADIRNKAVVQGGSTITQQFVKNAQLKNDRTISRKLKEAALAWQLEQGYSKDWILTAYLNTIYFGNGAYGIQQAAQTYFGHGAREMAVAEAALLAGIPADPASYDPVANPRAARQRRNLVLQRMLEQAMIGPKEFLAAKAAPLPRPADVRPPGIQGPAHYFGNYVKQQLIDRYGTAGVFGGGLRVTTTIDLELQKRARRAISKWLTNPDGPSAALVAIDPRDGRVLAMVGGKSIRESEFNLAVQAERQPGSAFKPFVLAAALERGVAPATQFESRPKLISLGDRFWSVENYEDAYLGTIDLETATIHSDNAVYADLTQLVGPSSVVDVAKRLGVRSKLDRYFAIGLGVEAVNPLELARAFATFASGGARIDGSIFGNAPRAIESVIDKDEEATENKVVPRRAVDRGTASVVSSLLEDVVRRGTGTRAALADRPAAGKTGTTENYGDAWFVGYTPQLVTAVWVGYPNTLRPMLTEFHGEPVAGGTFPALIWKTFMESALRHLREPPAYFPLPPFLYGSTKRVVWRNGRLMLDNGLCKGAREVVYLAGRGPTRTAGCKPNEVEVPRLIGRPLAAAEQQLREQPLTPLVARRPAEPGKRVGIVVDQYPKSGALSSYERVTLMVSQALHGVVPKLVGLSLRDARGKLRKLDLTLDVAGFSDGPRGRIVAQEPQGGVAAKPGSSVSVVVARG